jgi:protein arginine N-methyltransferase 5
MSSPQPVAATEGELAPMDDFIPTFYVGHHETKRALPVTDSVLRQAQDIGVYMFFLHRQYLLTPLFQYDMLTSPITTPAFQSRVLSLISSHLKELSSLQPPEISSTRNVPPAPIIPPLTPEDTPLAPGDTVSQLIAYSSPWIDLCSPDPLISNISRQVLNVEIAYASFCGVGNVVIPRPRTYNSGSTESDGIIQYARAIQEALTMTGYLQISVQLPMYGNEEAAEITGDLRSFARNQQTTAAKTNKDIDLFETWDAWNLIRSVCTYSSRLSVGKKPYTIVYLPHFADM